MSDLKIQGEVSLDTSSADAAFARVEQSAGKMARGVQDQAGKAGKSIGGMGDGGDQAAQKLDRSTKSIIASVQRATAAMEAGERGSAKYFETLANQRGANVEALRPYIAQLEAVRAKQDSAAASLGRVGISAGQTAAALRGVPAQFTDIITSLQGGQAPLTVFLQQGGQLKDMFGGAGNAARALGGYIAGLVNPFTLAAAGVAVLAVAYNSGANEAQEFRKQIILSGNAAGVTSDRLASMAASISGAIGTQGKAAEVLALLVSTGRVSRDVLYGAAEGIIAFSSATGQSVDGLVKSFGTLGKGSSEAILKLNEQYNFLTAATYEQIVALEKQGMKEEAAALAQRTYSDMLKQRAKEVKDNLGLLESAWASLGGVVKKTWDGMLGIGRDATFDEQIASLERRRDRFAANPGFNPGQSQRDAINEYNLSIGRLRTEKITKEAAAARQAAQVAIQSAGNEAAKSIDEQRKALASSGEKMKSELAKYRQDIDALRKANPKSGLLDASQIAADEAAIRDKYKDKAAISASNRAAKAAEDQIKNALALVDELAAKTDGMGLSPQYTQQVQLLSTAYRSGAISLVSYNQAMDQLLERQPFAIAQAKAQAEAEKSYMDERKKRYSEVEKQYEEEVKGAQQSAKAVQDRVQSMKDEEAAIVLAQAANITLAQAIEDVRIARLNEAIASAKISGGQEKIDALQAEITARKEIADLTDRKTGRDAAADAFKEFIKSDVGTNFAAGFDKASASLGTFVQSFQGLISAQDKYNKAKGDASGDTAKMLQLDRQYTRNQISGYAAMAGAAKSFFGEKTGAYKAMVVAEQALRAIELASAIASVTESATVGTAKAAVAVANQGTQGDPYTAIPRMAAVAAIMASLGFAVAGSIGGSSGGGFAPTNTGTGTVLGDASAQSESITKSIEALTDVDILTMRYSAQMLASLQSIESNIGGVATLLVQSGGASASAAGVQTGFQASALGNYLGGNVRATASVLTLGISELTGIGKALGNLVSGLFGTSTSIKGQGIYAGGQALSTIAANGFQAAYYTDVERKQKVFGITTSTSRDTYYSDADAQFKQQATAIFDGFTSAVLAASVPLGMSLDAVQQRLGGFVVDIGRIDLNGLSGAQIQERLTAVFGAAGDNIAAAALPGLQSFQKVGDGYLETVVRVASGLEEGRQALRRLGVTAQDLSAIVNKQGDVGAELVRQSLLAAEGLTGVADILKTVSGSASEVASTYKSLTDVRMSLKLMGLDASAVGFSLIDGAGGLQELLDAVESFQDGFLSGNEQVAIKAQRLSADFVRLGLVMPSTGSGFVDLVKGIDTSSEAGKLLLGSVLSLSGGFADLLDAIKDVGSGIEDEIARIKGLTSTGTTQTYAELQASFAINTAKARAGDQSAIDLLPAISQALLKAAEATASSSLDVAAIQAQTLTSLQATLAAISDPKKYLQGYASGGTFSGGYRIVGENGPEIEATGPARIFDASQTARILNGSGSDSELRALRLELAAYREEQRIGMATVAANTGKTARTLDSVTQDGTAITTVSA